MANKSSKNTSYYSFIFLGIVCLLSWNVVLASLDIFNEYFKEYNPTYYFPIMNFILNVVFQFFLVFFGNKFSYFRQMFISVSILIVTMIALPFILFYSDSKIGFYLSCIAIILNGFSNAIFQSNLYGICGFLPFKFVVGVSYGNGIAGLGVNIIKYIILASFDENDSSAKYIQTYLFFGITVLILTIGLVLIIVVFNNPWFIYHVNQGGLNDEFSQEKIDHIIREHDFPEGEKKLEVETETETEKIEEESKFQEFKKLAKSIYNFKKMVFLIFFCTFILFPGLLFEFPVL